MVEFTDNEFSRGEHESSRGRGPVREQAPIQSVPKRSISARIAQVESELAQTMDGLGRVRKNLNVPDEAAGDSPSVAGSQEYLAQLRVRAQQEAQHERENELWNQAVEQARTGLQSMGMQATVQSLNAEVWGVDFRSQGERRVLGVEVQKPTYMKWTMDIELNNEYIAHELPLILPKIAKQFATIKQHESGLRPLQDSDFTHGRDELLFSLGAREVEKTEGHRAMLRRANDMTNRILKQLGLPPKDFDIEEVSIVKEQHWDRRGRAVAVPEIGKIFVKEANLRIMDKIFIHEMLHMKLQNALPEPLMEALVEEVSARAADNTDGMPDALKAEALRSEILKQKFKEHRFSDGRKVVEYDTFYVSVSANGTLYAESLTYQPARELLGTLCGRLVSRFPELFKDPAAVKKFLLQSSDDASGTMLAGLEQKMGKPVFSEIQLAGMDYNKIESIIEAI